MQRREEQGKRKGERRGRHGMQQEGENEYGKLRRAKETKETKNEEWRRRRRERMREKRGERGGRYKINQAGKDEYRKVGKAKETKERKNEKCRRRRRREKEGKWKGLGRGEGLPG